MAKVIVLENRPKVGWTMVLRNLATEACEGQLLDLEMVRLYQDAPIIEDHNLDPTSLHTLRKWLYKQLYKLMESRIKDYLCYDEIEIGDKKHHYHLSGTDRLGYLEKQIKDGSLEK